MVRADGIPLDKFGPLAASEATLMFALLGMYLLLIPLQSVIVLIRYRSMIPFMLLMLMAVQLGTRGVHLLHPAPPVSAAGGAPIGFYVNLVILGLTVIAFVLSLVRPREQLARQGA